MFSTSLYKWNPSLINLLYKRNQGIPLMARLTWICRSYSQQPKSTTNGRHIWSSKYVMYDSSFVNFFLVSRSFQFRVRKPEKGGARWIWTKCKYFPFLNFSTNSTCKYKRNDITRVKEYPTRVQFTFLVVWGECLFSWTLAVYSLLEAIRFKIMFEGTYFLVQHYNFWALYDSH